MNKDVILIGGGGHCKSCIDVIEQEGRLNIYGILDLEALVGQQILGYEIKGTDTLISSYAEKGFSFLITIGQIRNAASRKTIYNELLRCGADIATVISPKAHVSEHSRIGRGTIVMHHCVVNADAVIGENNILNTGCIIEHDVEVADHCHISTGAIVNGNCKVGNECFIGSSAIIVHGIEIKENIVVGAGAVVNKNLTESGIYSGNPVKKHGNK